MIGNKYSYINTVYDVFGRTRPVRYDIVLGLGAGFRINQSKRCALKNCEVVTIVYEFMSVKLESIGARP